MERVREMITESEGEERVAGRERMMKEFEVGAMEAESVLEMRS